ncbi:hypothetical protein GCM10018952_14400 [Streptosporangium vulgare]
MFYTDVFRGLCHGSSSSIFVGFGLFRPRVSALQGTPTDPRDVGIIALTLSYGAYVAEVFRAGIVRRCTPASGPPPGPSGLSRGPDPCATWWCRRRAQGVCLCRCQRLRLAAEGHRARRTIGPWRRCGEAPNDPRFASTFKRHPTAWRAAPAAILLTIPMARFTSYLAAPLAAVGGAT